MKTYYLIALSFGDNKREYWCYNSENDVSTKLEENAEWFSSKEKAEKEIKNKVMPYAENHGWIPYTTIWIYELELPNENE